MLYHTRVARTSPRTSWRTSGLRARRPTCTVVVDTGLLRIITHLGLSLNSASQGVSLPPVPVPGVGELVPLLVPPPPPREQLVPHPEPGRVSLNIRGGAPQI